MTRKCLIEKHKREPKYRTRKYNRCALCGRARAYYRKFDICRCCLRKLALEGVIPGLKKASW
ncbi:MAG: type Z 30S ribosomal protein S14 [Planctomycetota bacterium]|nr:MAG: type Z 30S ribosomal protein S14 [Planctomycetota bacterium]